MDSHGKLFSRGEPQPKSRRLDAYETLKKNGFEKFDDSLTPDDLDWIQRIHDKNLKFYMEERRLHFGAFALCSLAFVILFPALLAAEQYFLALAGVEGLLFVLLVPYVFVYRRYEEGVRRMMRESIEIENHRERQREDI